MTKNTKSFVLPLTFIGIMFFAIGFALGINSLLVPVLQKSLGISNTASYLIIAATFIPFLVFGYPAGLTIKAIGYKRTMSLSFFIFCHSILPVHLIGRSGKLHLIFAGFFYQRSSQCIPTSICKSIHHHSWPVG